MARRKYLSKYILTKIGERLSERTIEELYAATNYLAVGRWMKRHGYLIEHRSKSRYQLFDLIGKEVGDKEVLYMEFGVYKGDATRYWTRLLTHPNARLHGFDSFEGLPDSFTQDRNRGFFSTSGRAPEIDDKRVQFFKGWFQDTVPCYELPPHEVLLLNMDADLYSSTAFVLGTLERHITVGSYIYFDEFNHKQHELRAFDEFLGRSRMTFSLIGADTTLAHVAFKRVA